MSVLPLHGTNFSLFFLTVSNTLVEVVPTAYILPLTLFNISAASLVKI